MEVKRWQKKTWLLARYLEVAVPVTCAVFMIWVCSCSWKIAEPWTILWVLTALACVGMLRELAETICKRQALDWLASIKHRLVKDEPEQLKMQVEGLELHICQWPTLLPVIVLIALSYAHIRILSALAWFVVDVMMGGLIISMFLIARTLIRDIHSEIAKEWHSS